MTQLVVSLLWIAGIVFALFAFLEGIISDDTKKLLAEYLRSKPGALDDLRPVAAALFERVFGPSHFSLRCLGASVLASSVFIALLLVLRSFLVMAVSNTGPAQYLNQEIQYLSYKEVRTSFLISFAANVIFDYFSLLKTRLIIAFLSRRKNSLIRGFSVVVVDLILGFAFFQIFYFILYLAAFVVSVLYGRMWLPAGDAYSFGPMVEALIIFLFASGHVFPTSTVVDFLAHSHAIGIFLLVALIPFFLVSVFFYASMAPSIWLWLFFLSAAVSRLIAPSWPAALEVLNFEKAPIKMLGLIASVLIVLFVTFGLSVLALGLSVLGALLS